VQQKVCTGHAVVKPCKLYVVQCHVNQRPDNYWEQAARLIVGG